MLVDDILQLAHNNIHFESMTNGLRDTDLKLLRNLPKMRDLSDYEASLREQNLLDFQIILREPLGTYLLRTFLFYEHSIDKAIFINDVEIFKKLKDPFTKQITAEKIYNKYLLPEMEDHIHGMSAFSNENDIQPWYAQRRSILYCSQKELNNHRKKEKLELLNNTEHKCELKDDGLTFSSVQNGNIVNSMSFMTENTNSIGIYGRAVTKVKEKIDNQQIVFTLFDAIYADIINDLRLDAYPRFQKSPYYTMYIRCKAMERKTVTIRDFMTLKNLGRGEFGIVCAGEKRNCRKSYAMKQMSKRKVQATDSLNSVMKERDCLAMMNSKFFTSMKYALVDDDTMYSRQK